MLSSQNVPHLMQFEIHSYRVVDNHAELLSGSNVRLV